MSEPPTSLTVHYLTVTLLDVSPPIWRRLRVPSSSDLLSLHHVVQVAMGWEDRHLHEWEVDEVVYGPPDEPSWGETLGDESQVTLAEVAPLDGVLTYRYDMGDTWEHLVEVTAVESYDATVIPVACLDGSRAAPPEDCGGPSGYEHLIDALADPDDAEHEDMVAWLGDSWDPENFDRVEVDRRLEELWRPGGALSDEEPEDEDDDGGFWPDV